MFRATPAARSGGIRVKGFKIGGGGGKGEVNATIYIVDSTTGQVVASKSVVGTHKRKALGVGYNAGGWGAAFGGNKKDNVGLAVQDACAAAVNFMIEQLPNYSWTGSVVMVKNGQGLHQPRDSRGCVGGPDLYGRGGRSSS